MSNPTSFETCSALYDVQSNLAGFLNCSAVAAQANVQAVNDDLSGGLNQFFLIFGGALVFFMQIGFAMLCAGSIRAKNVRNVMLWNLLDSAGGGISYYCVGYAFAYGSDGNETVKTFVGTSQFFLAGSDINYSFFFFQWAFASALSSIVAGTIAERTKMIAYLGYSTFLVGFVYPVVSRAFWSIQGFLSITAAEPLWGAGVIDLAGSGPVHLTGGVAALAAALIIGPRLGRFYDRDGNVLDPPAEIPPHSVALQFLGTFALWFGWYGFNPASVLATNTTELGTVVSLVAVNTTLSACAGALSALFTSTLFDYWSTGIHTYDAVYTMNGCLTGLVAITGGCASVQPWAAVIIGVIAGWGYLGMSKLLIKWKIDDAVDAIPVHMIGGTWGVLATGLFSAPTLMKAAYGIDTHVGWFYSFARGSGDFTLLGCQLVSIVFIYAWTFATMGAFFLGMKYMGQLRVDELEEEVGMDISRHKGSAYEVGDSSAVHSDAVDRLNMSRSGRVVKIDGPSREEEAVLSVEEGTA